MPFAFGRAVAVEQWNVGMPVEKAHATTAIYDQEKALISVPSLRARITVGAVFLPAYNPWAEDSGFGDP
jgi:hypothetical protein